MGWVEVWEWAWLGGCRECLGWDSVQRAVDMSKVCLVELVGVRVGAGVELGGMEAG